jgi:hypothetical protein
MFPDYWYHQPHNSLEMNVFRRLHCFRPWESALPWHLQILVLTHTIQICNHIQYTQTHNMNTTVRSTGRMGLAEQRPPIPVTVPTQCSLDAEVDDSSLARMWLQHICTPMFECRASKMKKWALTEFLKAFIYEHANSAWEHRRFQKPSINKFVSFQSSAVTIPSSHDRLFLNVTCMYIGHGLIQAINSAPSYPPLSEVRYRMPLLRPHFPCCGKCNSPHPHLPPRCGKKHCLEWEGYTDNAALPLPAGIHYGTIIEIVWLGSHLSWWQDAQKETKTTSGWRWHAARTDARQILPVQ